MTTLTLGGTSVAKHSDVGQPPIQLPQSAKTFGSGLVSKVFVNIRLNSQLNA